MTQQTDRLAVVRENLAYVDSVIENIGSIIHGSKCHEFIKNAVAALSQPAAHPEPDNAGALDMPADNAGYDKWGIWAWWNKDKLKAALAKPAVPEIASDDADCIYEALFQMNRTADYLRGKDHHKVCVDNQEMARNAQAALSRLRAYLKLSGQKEGS